MTAGNYEQLPADLPVPEDDGAAAHLTGAVMPSITLPATSGEPVDLSRLGPRAIVYVYPMTGTPEKPTLGTALPQWFALCALKTASSLPIKVGGGGGGKTKPLKVHCGHAVGDEPPGSALKVVTVRAPPK